MKNVNNKEELVFAHWYDIQNNPVSVGYRVDEDSNTLQYAVARKNPKDQENRKVARHVIREKFLEDDHDIIIAAEMICFCQNSYDMGLRQRALDSLKANSFNHTFYHQILCSKLSLYEY